MADSGDYSLPLQNCIPVTFRLYFYGMLGFTTEIVFTGLWYLLDSDYNYGWTLVGSTSLWAFPIYSVSMYVIEKMYLELRTRLPLAVRGLLYIVWTYIWEFSCGLVLRQFGACPWNYQGYTSYHVMGLVTFDYAPMWYIGTILLETIFIKYILALQHRKLKQL